MVDSQIHPTSKVESGSDIKNSVFGKHTFCGYDCEIYNTTIGSFCSIGNNVKIGGGEHPIDWVSTSPVFYQGRDSIKKKYSSHKRSSIIETSIGNDCWIGQNALIKQGVNIGTGAVIGMGSVVTKNVAPYSIVAGNPAILIRKRFNKNVVEKLLESEWWNLEDEVLEKVSVHINRPSIFLNKIK